MEKITNADPIKNNLKHIDDKIRKNNKIKIINDKLLHIWHEIF